MYITHSSLLFFVMNFGNDGDRGGQIYTNFGSGVCFVRIQMVGYELLENYFTEILLYLVIKSKLYIERIYNK